MELPSGTVTFLFTDLEGSTRLWESHPEAMRAVLARHDEILRDAVEKRGGLVVKTTGDGLHAAFATAPEAVTAATDAQLALEAEDWTLPEPLRVRMGVHTGGAEIRDGDYYGPAVNRAARLSAAAHGGQIVVSHATEELIRSDLPAGAALFDLGEHRLRDLGESMRVFQLGHSDLVADFPPLRSLDALPGNLPRQATTFVGRDDDIATLVDFLATRSLVTLTGVGGVGKTRLAIQVAAELVPDFADGAWLCELASVSDPDAVWDTLAASLGVRPAPGRSLEDSVLEYLGPKRLLLVLDNCEHLLDAAARVVTAIAARCPRVVVLATSREGLAVAGQQIMPVPSLGLPGADVSLEALSGADAVRLFVDRAHDAKPDFALTDRNSDAVAQLCRRLDGIPLALELAAARVRSLTPEDLVARLDQRFRLLTRGSRAALERHQTLRNTIDWSYDLLGETEREALNRLSVFAGGADLAAAEAVVSGGSLDEFDAADALSQLVDKSLVVVDEDDAGVRYRLLESIRQYAQERLEAAGDAAEVRRRHADHYVARAEAAGPRLRGREQIETAHEVLRDIDNFRAVFDFAAETTSIDHALRLIAPLAVHGTTIGYAAMDWADTAVEFPGASEHPLFPVVGSWAVLVVAEKVDLERAATLVERVEAAEATLGTRYVTGCMTRSTLALLQGDLEQARYHAEAGVGLARPTGDPYEIAMALTMYGVAAGFSDSDGGVASLDEAVRIARDAGPASVLSTGLMMLAVLLPFDEEPRRIAILDEAIEVGMRIGDLHAVSNSNSTKAILAARSGQWRPALRAGADAAEQQLQFGHLNLLGPSYWAAALAFIGLGHLETAAVLTGAAEVSGPRIGPPEGMEVVAETEAALLESLGEDQFTALRARGAALEPADVVAYLRAEAGRILGDESAS